jgi:hypothetical protein
MRQWHANCRGPWKHGRLNLGTAQRAGITRTAQEENGIRANGGGNQTMARPVKETPVLTGEDAKRFTDAMKANETKTITPEEFKRIMDARRTIRFVDKKRG